MVVLRIQTVTRRSSTARLMRRCPSIWRRPGRSMVRSRRSRSLPLRLNPFIPPRTVPLTLHLLDLQQTRSSIPLFPLLFFWNRWRRQVSSDIDRERCDAPLWMTTGPCSRLMRLERRPRDRLSASMWMMFVLLRRRQLIGRRRRRQWVDTGLRVSEEPFHVVHERKSTKGGKGAEWRKEEGEGAKTLRRAQLRAPRGLWAVFGMANTLMGNTMSMLCYSVGTDYIATIGATCR